MVKKFDMYLENADFYSRVGLIHEISNITFEKCSWGYCTQEKMALPRQLCNL